jgi:hypothetical protein
MAQRFPLKEIGDGILKDDDSFSPMRRAISSLPLAFATEVFRWDGAWLEGRRAKAGWWGV